jgi:hypothetical protein
VQKNKMSVNNDNTYTQYGHKLCSGSTHLSYGGGSGPRRLLVLHSSINRLCEASSEVCSNSFVVYKLANLRMYCTINRTVF